ncbi:hypothetical protein QAD02_006669 [Eretmocerus hayati]|uniref:Uncharacterized protein n=1 Tax=Eretmocerus hayati TaxID=131215 RepID=A0ACC2N3W2_9HYME|nr:hypothetical protein QAD02_006669 [Eretmocerus hayati]
MEYYYKVFLRKLRRSKSLTEEAREEISDCGEKEEAAQKSLFWAAGEGEMRYESSPWPTEPCRKKINQKVAVAKYSTQKGKPNKSKMQGQRTIQRTGAKRGKQNTSVRSCALV